ncbi:DUF255 domain-containing protein [Persephonella sp.]
MGYLFAFLVLVFSVSASEIHWLTFEKGMELARKENRPVLLDIYAQWCHWCNVMENTTYRDKRVMQIIKKHYIPVRVDSEERPEINRMYNQGGLPSTVILTPEGKVVWGGIYVPPDKMVVILERFAQLEPEKLKAIAEENEKKANRALKRFLNKDPEKPSPEYIQKVFRYIKMKYDRKYGGFYGAPKFPEEEILHFLMVYHAIFSDKTARDMMVKTAEGYMRLIDPVEGGIFRYSTTEDWKHPHYEKLLKDQSDLPVAFFELYSITGDKKFLNAGLSLLKFGLEKLYSREKGLFYNSQGADIVDEKGTLLVTGEEYFILDREERQEVVKKTGRGPKIEKRFYFSTNSLFVKALLYGYAYTGKRSYLDTALKTLEEITEEGLTERGVVYSQNIKKYFLSTNIYYLEAVLTAYQITGNTEYLETGEKIFRILKKYYYSGKAGILADILETETTTRKISFIDDTVLLNRRAVRAFYSLSMFTGRETYRDFADSIVERLPGRTDINRAIAYMVVLYPPFVAHIIGSEDRKERFIRKVFTAFPYWNFTQFVDRNDRKTLSRIGYRPEKETVIYLCNPDLCFERLADPDRFREALFTALKNYATF